MQTTNNLNNAIVVYGNHEKNYNTNFNPNPTIPSENDNYQINEAKRNEWIDAHQEAHKPLMKEIAGKVTRITFKTFKRSLGNSVLSAKTELAKKLDIDKKDLKDRIIVLVENNKSNQWVAELAAKDFGLKASKYYRLGDKDANKFIDHINDHTDQTERSEFKNKVVVLLDDGSYSGTQITDHVKHILKIRKDLSLAGVCVIIPYMTQNAKELLQSTVKKLIGEKSNEFTLSDSKIIPTVATILSQKKLETINQLWWPNEEDTQQANGRGLYYFDHKIPNYASFPDPLKKGTVSKSLVEKNNNDSKTTVKGTHSKTVSKKEQKEKTSPEEHQTYRWIPEIKEPYKKAE